MQYCLKTENVNYVVFYDEYHFVLECTLYAEIRKVYISKYFWNRPNMYKFIELLCTDSKKMIKKLSMYTEKAFRFRKENMPI